jgi:hypothetical protein
VGAPEDPPEAPPAAPRWIVGDLHVHVSPPDEKRHSHLSVADAIAKSRERGLDFVVLTSHDAHLRFDALGERRPEPAAGGYAPGPKPIWGLELTDQLARETLAKDASLGAQDGAKDAEPKAAPPRPLLAVPGWEFTRDLPGHLGFAFFAMDPVAAAEDDRKAKVALAAGALVVVNHPFFRRVRCSQAFEKAMAASRSDWGGDRRWKPFAGIGRDTQDWNAIEVWHERSSVVEKLHRSVSSEYPETQMVRSALAAWDAATKAQRRRITGAGGSDCHGRFPYAILPMKVVGVRVDGFTGEALRRGLVGARVTFGPEGGLAARDFAATSDIPGERAGIGDSLRAKETVTLTWSGKAVLYEDGERAGEFEGGAVRRLGSPGGFRFWRIEKPGDQYSNMIYANL